MKMFNDFYLNFSRTFLKVRRGNKGIAPVSVNLGARLRYVVDLTPRPLYPRERTPHLENMRLFGGPKPVWTCSEMSKSATVIRSSVRPDRCLVTILTELPGPRNVF